VLPVSVVLRALMTLHSRCYTSVEAGDISKCSAYRCAMYSVVSVRCIWFGTPQEAEEGKDEKLRDARARIDDVAPAEAVQLMTRFANDARLQANGCLGVWSHS
jgi:hypothetical protein